ncbi:hypothetical protein GQ42DRAFT_75070 [Ramicandelaber brevisporus]|nr:hypothetical protein GQ42DRAFT_75070 [Ramicandelaber brevisporus]
MEDVAEQVARHCGEQLFNYSSCVDKNPSSWQSACLEERRAVTLCSEKHVSHLRLVKKVCAAPIAEYDKCLMENREDPSPCMEVLKKLYACTHEVSQMSKAIKEQQQQQQQQSSPATSTAPISSSS